MGNKFSILDGKQLNIDQIEGRFAAFAKVPYAVTLRLSQPIAEDGYGTITVDGVEIPRGTQFLMDMMVKCIASWFLSAALPENMAKSIPCD